MSFIVEILIFSELKKNNSLYILTVLKQDKRTERDKVDNEKKKK